MTSSSWAEAASLSYVITDYADPAHPHVVARGTKVYSAKDIQIVPEEDSGGKTSWTKSLQLASGYSIGASIYREPHLDGFGLWIRQNGRGFSWEWFDNPNKGVFPKLQEGGSVRVTYRGLPAIEEIASITFETDISLRLNLADDAGKVTQRVLVQKGSVLEFPP